VCCTDLARVAQSLINRPNDKAQIIEVGGRIDPLQTTDQSGVFGDAASQVQLYFLDHLLFRERLRFVTLEEELVSGSKPTLKLRVGQQSRERQNNG
jgi:hypothetical protein